MRIDDTHFPFVWMQMVSPGKDPDASPFTEFEALLARKEAFVLLNDEGFAHGSHEHSPEEMKQATRWMKAHKNELRTFVKASVVIEPNTVKRTAAKPFAVIFEKFWGYPLILASSKDDALVIAHNLLSAE